MLRCARRAIAPLGALLALVACEAVLAIEDADLDPELAAAGAAGEIGQAGTSAGAPGSGGSVGDAPASGGSSGATGSSGAPGSGGAPASGGAGGDGSTSSGGASGSGAGATGGASTGGANGVGGTAPSSGGSAGNPPDGAGGEDAQPPLCERYCTAVMKNCTGQFAVYSGADRCMAVCAALPEGTAGDEVGGSVQCRLAAAERAPLEVPHYCPIAGPGGNGVCGSNCEGFCRIVNEVCTGANKQFSDDEACAMECAQLADLGTFSTDLDLDHYEGPHVQCRLYHASAASIQPGDHCGHAGGDPPCQ
jgi:hypothetical protein